MIARPARSLLRRASTRPASGAVNVVDRAAAGWSWLDFAAYRLEGGMSVRRPADGDEHVVLVLEGVADVTVGAERHPVVGGRASVFDGPPPPVVLASPGTDLAVRAVGPALVVVAGSPAGPVRRTALIEPRDVAVEERGTGTTARRIHHLLPPAAEAGRLIAFEVFTPGGNWSSYPPHKHDTEDPPHEAYLEEVYFYRFARPAGYALQRVYTRDRSIDEVMAPTDCDVVLVPAGYHPVGVPAGYDCYYLNVMAGPNRAWHFTVDPDHAWLM
ncbi:MAG TPA: 5-deoxy-glucuronate isomerase, partial [Candidatus Limnocylindrales bacterium]